MDIVRKNIERLNGTISIDTKLGEGSTFTVKLPLTLAIIRALLVGYDLRIYAIPLASVMEITMIEPSDIQTVHGSEAIRLRGDVIPLLWLGDVLPAMAKRKGRSVERMLPLSPLPPKGR